MIRKSVKLFGLLGSWKDELFELKYIEKALVEKAEVLNQRISFFGKQEG